VSYHTVRYHTVSYHTYKTFITSIIPIDIIILAIVSFVVFCKSNQFQKSDYYVKIFLYCGLLVVWVFQSC
jgi:hypothetical protein